MDWRDPMKSAIDKSLHVADYTVYQWQPFSAHFRELLRLRFAELGPFDGNTAH